MTNGPSRLGRGALDDTALWSDTHGMHERHVLLVEADPEERERLGRVLETAGYRVSVCPGPTAPDYTCVGGRSGECPLVHDADLIVLDMVIPGEDTFEGTPAEDLLTLYENSGRAVIALVDRDMRRSGEDERSVLLERFPPGGDLVRAVRTVERSASI